MTTGVYERILLAALETMHARPWSPHDLVQAESAITDEVCFRISGSCDSAAARDWLKTLPEEEREELLQRLNGSHAVSSANGN